MWLTVSDGYRESQQMGRASMLKARTNKMPRMMLMLRMLRMMMVAMMVVVVTVVRGCIRKPNR